jgi:hypothetical protein
MRPGLQVRLTAAAFGWSDVDAASKEKLRWCWPSRALRDRVLALNATCFKLRTAVGSGGFPPAPTAAVAAPPAPALLLLLLPLSLQLPQRELQGPCCSIICPSLQLSPANAAATSAVKLPEAAEPASELAAGLLD